MNGQIFRIRMAKARKAGLVHRTLLLAYTHVKAIEQSLAAGPFD